MANVLEKFGLRPYRKLDGTPLVGAQNRYTIASGHTTAIFQGDMVIPLTTGNIDRHSTGGTVPIVGVFNGCQLDHSTGDTTNTLPIQAIDISQDPDNSDTSTSNANILVRINNHFYRSGTGL
jgi:hypothetical protein